MCEVQARGSLGAAFCCTARQERESHIWQRRWPQRRSPPSSMCPPPTWSPSGWERARSLSASCSHLRAKRHPPSSSSTRCDPLTLLTPFTATSALPFSNLHMSSCSPKSWQSAAFRVHPCVSSSCHVAASRKVLCPSGDVHQCVVLNLLLLMLAV